MAITGSPTGLYKSLLAPTAVKVLSTNGSFDWDGTISETNMLLTSNDSTDSYGSGSLEAKYKISDVMHQTHAVLQNRASAFQQIIAGIYATINKISTVTDSNNTTTSYDGAIVWDGTPTGELAGITALSDIHYGTGIYLDGQEKIIYPLRTDINNDNLGDQNGSLISTERLKEFLKNQLGFSDDLAKALLPTSSDSGTGTTYNAGPPAITYVTDATKKYDEKIKAALDAFKTKSDQQKLDFDKVGSETKALLDFIINMIKKTGDVDMAVTRQL